MEPKTSEWRPGPTVCRCCLTEGCYKDISTEYFWMGKREVYSEMLSETFSVSISYSKSGGPNSQSRLICEQCISRLRDAADFKRQVVECEKMFMQHLDPGTSSVVEFSVPQVESSEKVKLERVKVEKVASDDDFDDGGFPDDDDDDDDLDDQPLMKLASKIPKKESLDLRDLLDNTKLVLKRKAPPTSKTKPVVPTKKLKSKKEVKPAPSKAKAVAKPAPKPVEKKKKGPTDYIVKWTPKRKFYDHRDNAAIIIGCSNVIPFRWRSGAFTCAFCPLSFGDFDATRAHIAIHSNRFEALRQVKEMKIKIEISNLRCEICFLPVGDLDSLVEHLLVAHGKNINKEHGLGVAPFIITSKECICPICKESFELFSSLNKHFNVHDPTSICFLCGKMFSTKTRLSAHLAVHDLDVGNVRCGKCNETFANRATKNAHIKAVHKKECRYRCQYCNISFKSYSDRGKHLKQYHGHKVEYPCSLCPRVFAMCNQRTKHIKQVHTKPKTHACTFCTYSAVTAAQLRAHLVRHVGERTFQCEVCKKSYARMKTLKEHMRIHNNDKRFVCDHCNSAYVQKCSLQSHIRTHHPDAVPVKKMMLGDY